MINPLIDTESRLAELYGGIVRILVENEIGRWSDDTELEEGPIPAITLGKPEVEPIRMLTLNLYPLTTDEEPGVDKMGAVFLIRTPETHPLKAVSIADKLEDVFHGREHEMLSKWHVPVMWRHSLADLGPNENDHYQLTDTYHFYVDIYRKAADNG